MHVGIAISAGVDFSDQDRLDDLRDEGNLVPPNHAKRGRVVFIPEALLDELSFVPPNQEEPFIHGVERRPQRTICRCLRKAIRSLNKLERKVLRLIYFQGLSHTAVRKEMKLKKMELEMILQHTFSKLSTQLSPLVS